jgi:hypothetical protein
MSNPWRSLEEVSDLAALAYTWRKQAGKLFKLFRMLCLDEMQEAADFYPCEMSVGCTYRVIRQPGQIISGICERDPRGCPHITLSEADVTPIEFNWQKFADALCCALNLDSKFLKMPTFQTAQIGTWSSDAVPVFLTLQNKPSQFRFISADLVARTMSKFILLAPSDRLFDAYSLEHLNRVRAAFFPLDNIITMTDAGILQPVNPPAEIFARLSAITPPAAVSPPSSEPKPRYAIRKGLGVWTIIFDYKEIVVKHEKGIFYVAWLLQHPGESIHALDLMAKIPEIYRKQLGLAELKDPATGKSITLESHARLQERNLGLDDAKAMRAIWKKQQELEAILDDESESEPVKAEALRELEAIVEFQRQHGRRSQDSAQRSAKIVAQSLRRFYQHLMAASNSDNAAHKWISAQLAVHVQKYILTPTRRFTNLHGNCGRRHIAGCFTYDSPPGSVWSG